MANNYSSACFAIPAPDADLTRRRMKAIDAFFEEDDETLLPVDLFGDHAGEMTVAMRVRRENYGAVGFAWVVEGDKLYFEHDETIDMENAVAVAQILLDLHDDNETYTATWADTCSKPRPDEFGGGAVAFNRHGDEWASTYDMARRLAERLTVAQGTRLARHTACRHCGQDIEGISPFIPGEWRDRGNNTHCPTDAGQQHEPEEEPRES